MPYTTLKITRESMQNQAATLRSELKQLPSCPKLARDLQLTQNWLHTFTGNEWWVVVNPSGQVCDGPCDQRKAERLAGEMNDLGDTI